MIDFKPCSICGKRIATAKNPDKKPYAVFGIHYYCSEECWRIELKSMKEDQKQLCNQKGQRRLSDFKECFLV